MPIAWIARRRIQGFIHSSETNQPVALIDLTCRMASKRVLSGDPSEHRPEKPAEEEHHRDEERCAKECRGPGNVSLKLITLFLGERPEGYFHRMVDCSVPIAYGQHGRDLGAHRIRYYR
jgi:hypothetical protein